MSTGPLTCPFACPLAPLTRGTEIDSIDFFSVFFSVLDDSVMGKDDGRMEK